MYQGRSLLAFAPKYPTKVMVEPQDLHLAISVKDEQCIRDMLRVLVPSCRGHDFREDSVRCRRYIINFASGPMTHLLGKFPDSAFWQSYFFFVPAGQLSALHMCPID